MPPKHRSQNGNFDMTARKRKWFFTWNNYTEEDVQMLKNSAECEKSTIRHILFGHEICPKTGTPHLQGNIYFKNAISCLALKKRYGKVPHWEPTRGNEEQVRDYCSKEDGEWYEYGEPECQGKRNDINLVKEMIKQGKGMRDILEVATSFQSIRSAEIRLKYGEPQRFWKTFVQWFCGPTGSKKTRKALKILMALGEVYKITKGKWWEGYDGHKYILIDDYRPDFCSFEELLTILDRYPVRVECKGGSRELLARHIIITTPLSPEKTWEGRTNEDMMQLLRRIDEIVIFKKKKDTKVKLPKVVKYVPSDSESDDEDVPNETKFGADASATSAFPGTSPISGTSQVSYTDTEVEGNTSVPGKASPSPPTGGRGSVFEKNGVKIKTRNNGTKKPTINKINKKINIDNLVSESIKFEPREDIWNKRKNLGDLEEEV